MPNTPHETSSNSYPSNLHPFDDFLKHLGLTRTSGYRYRRDGLIEAVNINGRLYVTTEAIKHFENRAVNGEFSRVAKIKKKFNGGQPNQ